MRILFIHQNYPGQYLHLAGALARDPSNTVVAIGEKKERPDYGYPVLTYDAPKASSSQIHHYVRDFESHIRRGQQVFRLCQQLKLRGFFPDVICAHPGWGEALFLKDIYPDSKLILFCEFYYRSQGSDLNFDPEFPANLDALLKVRIRNSTQLQSLCACDAGVSPTSWQQMQYPDEYRTRIRVLHDGVDTNTACPDPDAMLPLGGGNPVLTVRDEVVTYVARNLEPYRGFHSFMRAIPLIQAARPSAHIVVIGGNDVSYGVRPSNGETYASRYLAEVPMDRSRVHFLGRVSYEIYLAALRVSSAHVYLTYPFVLSWSCLEAMSAGCILVASRTAPVLEVIEEGRNGFLVDFFSPVEIAERVIAVLANQADCLHIRQNARADMQRLYDLHGVTLPVQIEMLHAVLAG